MPETNLIHAVCPECGAEYDLEQELAGHKAECASCHKSFVIPGEYVQRKDDQGEVLYDDTDTAKLQRHAAVGMVPEVEDEFKVGVVQTTRPASVEATSTGIKFTTRSFSTGTEANKQVKKPWWKFW